MRNNPEFSRPVRLDRLGAAPHAVSIEANAEERAALAERFGLIGIDSLAAEAGLVRSGEQVTATGRLSARVTQRCVATAEPVEEAVDETFTIIFRPEPVEIAGEEEIELSEAEMDVVFYDGAAADLGEAVAETLSLSLNPYPRVADADEVLREAGVKSEAEAKADASPFAALAALKGKAGE